MSYIAILLNSDNSLVWGTDQNMRVSRWIFRWTIYLKSSLSLLSGCLYCGNIEVLSGKHRPAGGCHHTNWKNTDHVSFVCDDYIWQHTPKQSREKEQHFFKKQGPDFVTTGLVLIYQSPFIFSSSIPRITVFKTSVQPLWLFKCHSLPSTAFLY